MGSAGFLLQLLGLFASAGAVVTYILAVKDKSESYLKIGNGLFLTAAASIVAASLVLLTALATSDFSIEYVARYTDLALPLFYKLSAFWGGQSGSLLLWALLLVVFSSVEIFRLKKENVSYRASVHLACSLTAAFFILLVAFVQNPFVTLDFMPSNGNGLNPMLQNPGMVIHPPTLYIGFVGFTIVVAHAFAALMTRNVSTGWIELSRAWTMITWVFLTIGIVIGGWWAYVELGWGGYWAWDPVENASLFPWFIATAFIHSAYIYKKKGSMKVWSFVLILITFELTILGTFITRSGVIESVHSFAKSSIGSFFLWFIVLTVIAYLITMFKNKQLFKEEGDFHFLTKEGVFFVANWLFVGITFVVVLGTFLPWITELLPMKAISVDLNYFNRVSLPFFIAILVASGIGPMIPFGNDTVGGFFKRLAVPMVFAVAVAVVAYLFGYTKIIPLILIAAVVFSFVTIAVKTFERIKNVGIGAFVSQNKFFAAMLVHFALVVMALGVTMSAFYNTQIDEIVRQDSVVDFNGYVLEIGQVHTEKGANYISEYVPVKIFKNGSYVSTAYPEMRIYNNSHMHDEDGEEHRYAEVAYYSMFKGDLYFIFSGYDISADQVRIQAIFQPFIVWIWAGCILMAVGGIYGAFNLGRRKEEKDK